MIFNQFLDVIYEKSLIMIVGILYLQKYLLNKVWGGFGDTALRGNEGRRPIGESS